MEDPSENYRAVLWVRHCFGCHNKVKFKPANPLTYAKFIPNTSSEQQAYKLPSYCTAELGEIQSLIFGYRLKNLIGKLDIKKSINKFAEKDIFLEEFEKISLYSSVLPRAMETAKLISKETIQSGLNKSSDEINRINFIQEKIEKKGDLVNSTTLDNSDEAVKILNTEFNEDRGYCLISEDRPIAARDEDKEFKTQNTEEIKKNYKDFKSQALEKLPYNKLNLTVSHSSFLKNALDFEEEKKMENLDAYLIIYKKTDGVWNEIPALRTLYLFAENKIIEPDKDGNLNLPIRDNRKNDIKKNNELIKDFGSGLLPGYLDDRKLKKSIYKTLGECKNEEIKIIENDNKPLTDAMGEASTQGLAKVRGTSGAATAVLGGGYKKTKKKKKSKKKRSKNKKSKKKKSKRKNKKSKRKNKRATKKE